MRYIGYHRTSTKQQHLDRGIIEITDFCEKNGYRLYRDKIYTDQQTGLNFERQSYMTIKEILEPGDALIITEIDRLGRDKKETMKEIQYLRDNHIRLMVLELPTSLMDLSNMKDEMAQMMLETINNMMLELYVSMAAAEMKKRKKRQQEGIEAMKLRGDWGNYGRNHIIELNDFVLQYRQLLETERLNRLILKSQAPLTKPKPLKVKDIYEKIQLSAKPNTSMSKASFYKYKKLAELQDIDINKGYEELFYDTSYDFDTAYAQFCKTYPILYKEKVARSSNPNKKPLTNKEIAKQLKIPLALFYRLRAKYFAEKKN